jgi:hypothetical protein
MAREGIQPNLALAPLLCLGLVAHAAERKRDSVTVIASKAAGVMAMRINGGAWSRTGPTACAPLSKLACGVERAVEADRRPDVQSSPTTPGPSSAGGFSANLIRESQKGDCCRAKTTSGRRQCAKTGRWPSGYPTGSLDPERPFEIRSVNGWEGRGSGLLGRRLWYCWTVTESI